MDENPYRAPQVGLRDKERQSTWRRVSWIEVLAVVAIVGWLIWVLLPRTQSAQLRPRPQTEIEVK
jgi:hypothetical protein